MYISCKHFLILIFCSIYIYASHTFASSDALPGYGFALQYELTNAKSYESFNAPGVITREQFAKMVYQFIRNVLQLEIPIKNTLCEATDYSDDLGVYARKICESGIMSIHSKKFRSQDILTQDEFIIVIERVIHLIHKYSDESIDISILKQDTGELVLRGNIVMLFYNLHKKFTEYEQFIKNKNLDFILLSGNDLQSKISIHDFCDAKGVLAFVENNYFMFSCENKQKEGEHFHILGTVYDVTNKGHIGSLKGILRLYGKDNRFLSGSITRQYNNIIKNLFISNNKTSDSIFLESTLEPILLKPKKEGSISVNQNNDLLKIIEGNGPF